jgi:8-oxo-dGTP diphosphatase
VFIFNNKGQFLIGTRGPSCRRGKGLRAIPGGIVEENETLQSCAIREVLEETSVHAEVMSTKLEHTFTRGVIGVTDHNLIPLESERCSFVTFWMVSQLVSGEPKAQEPDKCSGWEWISLRGLRQISGATDPSTAQFFWTPYPVILDMLLRNTTGELSKILLEDYRSDRQED